MREEYKKFIGELKQDKKRYEELLDIRDKELQNMDQVVKRLKEETT